MNSILCLSSSYTNSVSPPLSFPRLPPSLPKEYLKKVTTEFPDDIEAWIELAGIVELTDTAVRNLAI